MNLQSQPKGLTWKPFSFRIGFATPVANKRCVWWVVLRGCNCSWSASDSIYVSISSSWEPTSTWNHGYQLCSLSTLSAAVQWSISSIPKSYTLFGEKHHLWRGFVRSSYTGEQCQMRKYQLECPLQPIPASRGQILDFWTVKLIFYFSKNICNFINSTQR